MKLSNCIKTTILVTWLFSTIDSAAIVPQSHTDSYNTDMDKPVQDTPLKELISQEDVYAWAEKRQDVLEDILKQIIHNFQEIDALLEDLALEIHNNVIKTDNKNTLMKSLKESRSVIQHIKNNAFTQINELSLHVLLQFTQAFLTHLTKALNTGFSTLAPFEMNQIRSRPVDDEITPGDLYADLALNNKALIRVKNLAKKAGLTWYNKQYALLDNYLLQPCKKYSVPKRIAQLIALGSVGTYMWYHSESENPLLRQLLGYPPHMLGNSLDIEYHDNIIIETVPFTTAKGEVISVPQRSIGNNPKPLKALGQLDLFLIKSTSSAMPLVNLSLPLILANFKDELISLKTEVGKKITRTINFLKGGQHRLEGDGVKRIDSTITFDDLVGLEHAKSIGHSILKYIEDPERFARKKLTPEKGYFLYGPPGTGKSKFACALYGEVKKSMKKMGLPEEKFKFFEIKIELIIEKGVSHIIELAQQYAPCILLFDEIDLLGLQRVGGNPLILSEFLTSLSGMMESDPQKQVIILAATNNPENVDAAMLRRGRLGKPIYFDYPSYQNRLEFLIRRLDALSINIDLFNLDKLAHETCGCSWDDLDAMIKGALHNAQRFGIALTQEQLEQALDEEIRNILMFDDKYITTQEKKFIATYQAGTALAYFLLDTNAIVAKTTIHPVVSKIKEENKWLKNEKEAQEKQNPIEYGKTFAYRKNNTLSLKTNDDTIIETKVLLAGSIAQDILLGNKNTNYRPYDKQKAWSLMLELVFSGLDSNLISTEQKNKLLNQAHDQFAVYEQEVKELLQKNKSALEALSQQLEQKLSLIGKEIELIIKSS